MVQFYFMCIVKYIEVFAIDFIDSFDEAIEKIYMIREKAAEKSRKFSTHTFIKSLLYEKRNHPAKVC